MKSHADLAAAFVQDRERMHWHDKALWYVRQKRDTAAHTLPEWEALRELASQIKAHTMSRLDFYLEAFEKEATRNGVTVHWAKDAKEHNEIIYGILKAQGALKVVKSKSMLTEECGLNPYLAQKGIEVTDTDLGERIIQLKGDAPSHIVLPAIHLKKEDVSDIFHRYLKSRKGDSDPTYLTGVAREHLRQKFLEADAAITGVNFAVSENGAIVVCTNEGNADMGVSLAKVHIACMGIEKIIPRLSDLGVFTRLLARSATGQPVTAYTSHYRKPREGAQMHVVIVDNGRSEILQRKGFDASLHCIRCGACMNTCPVYRRSGGHSYRYVIPGPIGSVLGSLK
ncbi:MAG: 4Fe-4S ferredoxin, partial [Sulfurospirillum sp.]